MRRGRGIGSWLVILCLTLVAAALTEVGVAALPPCCNFNQYTVHSWPLATNVFLPNACFSTSSSKVTCGGRWRWCMVQRWRWRKCLLAARARPLRLSAAVAALVPQLGVHGTRRSNAKLSRSPYTSSLGIAWSPTLLKTHRRLAAAECVEARVMLCSTTRRLSARLLRAEAGRRLESTSTEVSR